MATLFSPQFTNAADAAGALRLHGFAVLRPSEVSVLAGQPLAALDPLAPSWNDLPPDEYLKDGGRYRHRRQSCFVARGGELALAPHRAHWQPVQYNALHGGMQRWFEPVDAAVANAGGWRGLVSGLAAVGDSVRGARPWVIEAHQFRIDSADGIGRPTPEGAHRDGVDVVAVLLVARERVKGGETRVFEAAGPAGQRCTLVEPWTLLLLDDARVIHETTPIQPLDPEAPGGWRDTLVLTFRAGGFQGD